VGENEIAKDGDHKRVGAAFGEEFVDPELKAAVHGELSTEDLVLVETEEEKADADAQESESAGVARVGGERHWAMIVKVGRVEKRKI